MPHTEIRTFRTTLKFSPEGTEVEEFDLVIPSLGRLTGTGKINRSHELAFKMRAALHSAMGAVAGLGSKGIPFTISGTSRSPSFEASMKNLAGDKVKEVEHLFHKKKKDEKEETVDP
jgi:hypothetical protein